jgi:hypothetical protein
MFFVAILMLVILLVLNVDFAKQASPTVNKQINLLWTETFSLFFIALSEVPILHIVNSLVTKGI